MDATEAKQLLEPIPGENFVRGDFAKGNGQCCAIGHIVRLKLKPEREDNKTCSDSTNLNPLSEEHEDTIKEIHEFCRDRVSDFLLAKYGLTHVNLAGVNNSPTVNDYTQSSIKARVMDLLNDMVEAGY